MSVLLLCLIYALVISNGMKSSLLGVAWPAMYTTLGVPLLWGSVLTLLINAAGIGTGLISGKVTNRFGVGRVLCVSIAVMATSILGFNVFPSFIWAVIFSIILGLTMGIVDPALNNFIALNYRPMHLSWLQCFWSIGAMIGPIVMSLFLAKNNNWGGGYILTAVILFVMAIILFFSRSLWSKVSSLNKNNVTVIKSSVSNRNALKINGVAITVIGALLLGSIGGTAEQWATSFLVKIKSFSIDSASMCMTFFYAGEMIARFSSGLLSIKIPIRILIRYSQIICFVGALCLILPLPYFFSMAGVFIIGFGFAPLYPLLMANVPRRFGIAPSQTIIGLVFATTSIGYMVSGPIFSLLGKIFDIGAFPYIVAFYAVAMLISSEVASKVTEPNIPAEATA